MAAASVYGPDIAVGRDTRASGAQIQKEFESGLVEGGANVHSLGIAPTPTVCCATEIAALAVVITASHNPPQYNGFKFFDKTGAISPEMEQKIEAAMGGPGSKEGCVKEADFKMTHMKRILDVVGRADGVSVLLDCAGGAGSVVTPKMLEMMGCKVVSINDNRDGFFPHGLEPTEKNLKDTIRAVKKSGADIGLAHDGDADRTCAISSTGSMIEWDTFLTALASQYDKVVTTVDASMRIEEFCKKVYRVAVGDVAVCQKIIGEGADFGGEPSGTFIFPDIHIFPDGVATAAKTACLVAGGDFEGLLGQIPSYPMQRIKIPCPEGKKSFVMEKVEKAVKNETCTKIDGIRVDRDWGWVLIRPSGTEEYMRITAEAKSDRRLEQIVKLAREWIG